MPSARRHREPVVGLAEDRGVEGSAAEVIHGHDRSPLEPRKRRVVDRRGLGLADPHGFADAGDATDLVEQLELVRPPVRRVTDGRHVRGPPSGSDTASIVARKSRAIRCSGERYAPEQHRGRVTHPALELATDARRLRDTTANPLSPVNIVSSVFRNTTEGAAALRWLSCTTSAWPSRNTAAAVKVVPRSTPTVVAARRLGVHVPMNRDRAAMSSVRARIAVRHVRLQSADDPGRRGHPFVGRVDELRALHTIVDGAAAGRGSAVLVLGEAGSGKSRLITEVVRRRGRCRGAAADPRRRCARVRDRAALRRDPRGAPARSPPFDRAGGSQRDRGPSSKPERDRRPSSRSPTPCSRCSRLSAAQPPPSSSSRTFIGPWRNPSVPTPRPRPHRGLAARPRPHKPAAGTWHRAAPVHRPDPLRRSCRRRLSPRSRPTSR